MASGHVQETGGGYLETVLIYDCRAVCFMYTEQGPMVLSARCRLAVRTEQILSNCQTCDGVFTNPFPEPRLPQVAPAPDGRSILTVSPSRRVLAWNWLTGTLLSEWKWPIAAPLCVAVAANGCTAAAADTQGAWWFGTWTESWAAPPAAGLLSGIFVSPCSGKRGESMLSLVSQCGHRFSEGVIRHGLPTGT